MIVRRYTVSGRVQGVGFRFFVESQARRLGVGGWVRNRADGTVEVLAAATVEMLGELRAMLEEGPAGSHVTRVVEEPASVLDGEDLTCFVRLRTAR